MIRDEDDEADNVQAKRTPPPEDNDLITVDLSDFPSRYRDVCPIGCGSKGLIFSALDQRSLRRLAVKKLIVKKGEKTRFLRQTLREIRILHRLEHQNIIKIYHVLVSTGGVSVSKPPVPSSFSNETVPSIESLYVGMELMDTDLRNVIAKTALGPEYSRLFMYQILRGVKYMHNANVIHRDLNPSNIFINMDTLMVKIGDFGVSRIHDSEYDHAYHMSMPLTTKYYQAPELLLHPHHYTKAVDVWALGCIFVEMLKGSPAFSGDHAVEQMEMILETIPVTIEDWRSVVQAGCNDTQCCAPAVDYPNQGNDGNPNKPLEKVVPGMSALALNLMKQLLCFDPTMRLPIEDALDHPYFASYSHITDESACYRPFRIEDELDEYSSVDLETMLQNESYSVTSSFSKSTDTNVSQAPVTDDWNLLRVNSSMGLPTNGSYRHLLSLADTTQRDGLSESEMRTMACDFDYGVQIHGCSFSKDRMSMDFRPISSDAGCFDPYKWDHGNARNSQDAKKEPAVKGIKSVDQNTRGVSRSDTGYNSSYCSSSITNRVSNALSSTLWSLSSPDVSSDHEHHVGCSTPDQISPQFNTATDGDSPANSPVLHEETHGEPAGTRRHTEAASHQSSRHRHHHHSHHHHHHSHHHHHHKHKSRQSNTSGSFSALHLKNGSGDSSTEHTEGYTHNSESAYNSDGCSRHKRGLCKKPRSLRLRDNADDSAHPRKKSATDTPKPKNVVVVTGPDEVEAQSKDTDAACEQDPAPAAHAVTTESDFDKKEAIHEHLGKSSTSAFETYVPLKPSFSCSTLDNATDSSAADADPAKVLLRHEPPLGGDGGVEHALSFFSSEGLAQIRNMWENDLSVPNKPKESEPMRPRTWSEGCRMRSTATRRQKDLQSHDRENGGLISGSILTRTLMQRLRSQFTQLFSESCCLTTPDMPAPLSAAPHGGTILGRIRHFSDDRRFVCSPQTYAAVDHATAVVEGVEAYQQSVVGATTCSSAENMYPGSISAKVPGTRLECPF